jgi:hypothetical protein
MAVPVVQVIYHRQELVKPPKTKWPSCSIIVFERAAGDKQSGEPGNPSSYIIKYDGVERDNVWMIARQAAPAVEFIPSSEHAILHELVLEYGGLRGNFANTRSSLVRY